MPVSLRHNTLLTSMWGLTLLARAMDKFPIIFKSMRLELVKSSLELYLTVKYIFVQILLQVDNVKYLRRAWVQQYCFVLRLRIRFLKKEKNSGTWFSFFFPYSFGVVLCFFLTQFSKVKEVRICVITWRHVLFKS